MSNPPPRTPVEAFRDIINRLMMAVETQRLCGLLAIPLRVLIGTRITDIRVRFYRLAEQIAAGTYKPRRPSAKPRKRSATPRPWQPSPLPTHFGWLYTLMPSEMYRLSVVGPRNQLERLLRDDPEMAALIQAAPDAMRQPLRSLCWMLAIKAPPILARPRRPRRPKVTPAPPPAGKPKAQCPKAPQPTHREKTVSAPSPLAGEGRGEGSPKQQTVRRTT